MSELKEIHRDILRHALGMDGKEPGYRNNYHAESDSAVLLEMKGLGLMSWREASWLGCGGIWVATEKGRIAVGAPLEKKADRGEGK